LCKQLANKKSKKAVAGTPASTTRVYMLDILANAVGSQIFQFEGRVVFDQQALQVGIVDLVIVLASGLQAFGFLGSKEDIEVII
jgi:hypothetical protein